MRGYLHEDFVEEYGSARAAFAAFCRDASPAEVRQLAAEWERLSAATAGWSMDAIASLMTKDLGGSWMPRSARELKLVSRLLQSPEPGARPRTEPD
jgi:hypothetical protein